MSRVSPIFWGKFLKWFWQTSICDLPPFNGQNSLTLSLSRATFFLAHGNPNPRSGPSHWRRYTVDGFHQRKSSSKERKTHANSMWLDQGGGFKDFIFSPLFGEDSHFDQYFSNGLKPPTRKHTAIFHMTWWKRILYSLALWNDQIIATNQVCQTISCKKTRFFVHLSSQKIGDVMCSSTFCITVTYQDELEPYQEVWGP